jgi:hypothetical protein
MIENRYTLLQESVILSGSGNPMPSCNHEEAGYRLVTDIVHALKSGFNSIMVRRNDTDVVIILTGHFYFREMCADVKLWVAFGIDKHFALHNINDWCQENCFGLCHSLSIFHAFTGCDTTSNFLTKGS